MTKQHYRYSYDTIDIFQELRRSCKIQCIYDCHQWSILDPHYKTLKLPIWGVFGLLLTHRFRILQKKIKDHTSQITHHTSQITHSIIENFLYVLCIFYNFLTKISYCVDQDTFNPMSYIPHSTSHITHHTTLQITLHISSHILLVSQNSPKNYFLLRSDLTPFMSKSFQI